MGKPRLVEPVNVRNVRYYRFVGQSTLLPTVTTILNVIHKPALIGWSINVTSQRAEEELLARVGEVITPELAAEVAARSRSRPRSDAAEWGTNVHSQLEQILRGEMAVEALPADVREPVEALLHWLDSLGGTVEEIEFPVASESLGYGGTIDLVVRLPNGMLAAIDWKTSRGIYPEYAAQIEAYRRAWNELYPSDPIVMCFVARYGREDSQLEVARLANPEVAWKMFLAARTLWQMKDNEEVWQYELS
jgi:Asp-tRNA(Asn)/Glu-tRNA(Gln) amidotransferase A subunit family amidase